MPDDVGYEANDDHRTLMEAEHIKADPVKMAKVRKISGRKLKGAAAVHSIADIKAAGKAMRIASKVDDGDADDRGKDYEADMHHETLMRAETIKSDPKRMAAVSKVSSAKLAAAKNVHSVATRMTKK